MLDDLLDIKTSKEILDKKINSKSIFLIYIFILLIISITFFLCLSEKETFIEAHGIVQQREYSSTFNSPANLPIEKIHKKNGDYVEKGETIITFDSKNIEEDIKNLHNNIINKEKKLNYKEDFKKSLTSKKNLMTDNFLGYSTEYQNIEVSKEKIQLEIDSEVNNEANLNNTILETKKDAEEIDMLISDYHTFLSILKNNSEENFLTNTVVNQFNAFINEINQSNNEVQKELISNKTYELLSTINLKESEKKDKNSEIKNLEFQITQSKNNQKILLLNIEEIENNSLISIEESIVEISNEIREDKQQLADHNNVASNLILKSDKMGIIEFTENIDIGKVVPEGTSIGKILNLDNKNKYIEVYISSSQLSDIKKNQIIYFKNNSISGNKSVSIKGVIKNILIQPKETENGRFYILECDIISDNNKGILGSEGQVNIITGKTKYIKYIWEKLFS